MQVPITDPIEYLLRRKFGFLLGPEPGTLATLVRNAARREEFEAYRAELQAKSPDEIRVLYDAELAKHRAEEKTKAEREEQARFFNQPHAKADFNHWSKAAHWTLDEAVALSFGKAPEIVSWANVEPFLNISPFAKQYGRLRDLALRARQWQLLYDPVLPGIFLGWAERTDIPLPPELVAAVKARGVQVVDWKKQYDQAVEQYGAQIADWKRLYEEHVADWKRACDELAERRSSEAEQYEAQLDQQRTTILNQQASIDELCSRCRTLETQLAAERRAAVPTREVTTRERDSLLKLVIGMAVGGYRYDPTQARSEKISEIAGDLHSAGVSLDPDTVRKWLKQAAELLPPKETE